MAGIAAADHVAVWNPATQTWAALGSNSSGNGTITAEVFALVIDSSSRVYAGGFFTNVAGIAAADRVAM